MNTSPFIPYHGDTPFPDAAVAMVRGIRVGGATLRLSQPRHELVGVCFAVGGAFAPRRAGAGVAMLTGDVAGEGAHGPRNLEIDLALQGATL